jgi:3-dehydroquinate synthase
MPMKLAIHSNIRDYEVVFEPSSDFMDELAAYPQAYFVIDQNVWNIYRKTIMKNLPEEKTIILPIDENQKTLQVVQKLYDRLMTDSSKRNLTMISIGGGILQDITGFTASTIYRGIKWIFVPTTLLAQADSCIGSKTSLNYNGNKNLIGTFYPPARIHIYTPFLATLKEADFFSGFGEVVKLHLMGGAELFQEISKHAPTILECDLPVLLQAIQTSLQVKLAYMAEDEFDTGRRNLLNFGHDFGHALESASDFSVPHGQAVIFGMLAANVVARNRGLMDGDLEKEIAQNLLIPSLKILPQSSAIEPKTMINFMKKDKKRTGQLLALIMMQSGFEFIRVNDLTSIEVETTLAECKYMLGW